MDISKVIKNIGNRLGKAAKNFSEPTPEGPHPDDERLARQRTYMKRIHKANPRVEAVMDRRKQLQTRRNRGQT